MRLDGGERGRLVLLQRRLTERAASKKDLVLVEAIEVRGAKIPKHVPGCFFQEYCNEDLKGEEPARSLLQ